MAGRRPSKATRRIHGNMILTRKQEARLDSGANERIEDEAEAKTAEDRHAVAVRRRIEDIKIARELGLDERSTPLTGAVA